MNRSRTATGRGALATASLVLTACGRDDSGAEAAGQGEAISGGEATGTIDVWAMGTEGDVLQDFSAAFEEAPGSRHTTRSPTRSPPVTVPT